MNPYFRYLWLIPILPLAGGLINGLFGKRFAKSMVATVALFFTGASFLIACAQAWTLVQAPAPTRSNPSTAPGFAPAASPSTSASTSTISR